MGERGADPGGAPIGGRLVGWEDIDRQGEDESRALTPTKIDGIFRDANRGDCQAQARLAVEIEEKDWDVSHPLSTRRAAVKGIAWQCLPPKGLENDATAKRIAEAAGEMLRNVPADGDDELDFGGLLDHMLLAILPGYSWTEIVWGKGGGTIEAFVPGMVNAVTFRDSVEPRLATTAHPEGLPFAPNKFVFHRHNARSGDSSRGGLIRPLGWMYLFEMTGVKDLMRFAEKFGMPFVSARLDDNAWEKDRTKIAYLIRNFGRDGGAVFSKAVETELVQAAQGGADLYFKMLEYFGAAKTKVVLGQTATSGDAGGFSKGQAQENVRQDILEADARALEGTLRRDVLQPWTMFTHGPDAPVPVLSFDAAPAEDMKDKAEIVTQLSEAGLQPDPEWAEKTFNVRLARGPDGKLLSAQAREPFAMAGEKKKRPLPLTGPTNRW